MLQYIIWGMENNVMKQISDQVPFLIYGDSNNKVQVKVVVRDETIWLPQKGMAELFQTTPNNIGFHLKNI
jgi:hypothetical protein